MPDGPLSTKNLGALYFLMRFSDLPSPSGRASKKRALARPLGRAHLRFGPEPSLTVGLVPRSCRAATQSWNTTLGEGVLVTSARLR